MTAPQCGATPLDRALDSYLEAAATALCLTQASRIVKVPGGSAAWDDCCEGGGQLYIRVVTVQPITTQRRSAAGPECDIFAYRYRLAIGALRCAATIDDQGNPPSPAALAADTEQMVADMDTLRASILAGADTIELTSWAPLGPTGGCHGGEWQFAIRLMS